MKSAELVDRAGNEVKQIFATHLNTLLDSMPSKVKILSLDCFDTLLWRKTATPQDVFYDLQNYKHFKEAGLTAQLRIQAETKARQINLLKYGSSEVNLEDIYKAYDADLSAETIQQMIQDELTAEINSCYAFPPVLDLIRQAYSRGLKIIIVSDTYFKEEQLRTLLEKCLPADVMQAIWRIYCSCEHGRGKSNGLFRKVIDNLYESKQALYHLGDNAIADYLAPRTFGIAATHLRHFEKHVGDLQRMQALCGTVIDPTIRLDRSLYSPFHGVLAAHPIDPQKPEVSIGYAALGPILYSFAKYICGEVKKYEDAGKNLKVVFLMRDGYLPYLTCEAVNGKTLGHKIRISRFAANASSFNCLKNIDEYLLNVAPSLRFADIGKQLQLPEEMHVRFAKEAAKTRNPAKKYIELIHDKDVIEVIKKNSAAYRKRLLKHLEREIGLTRGDTLMFVDLGYTGTAQLRLQSVLKSELDVDIVGCYLIALPVANWRQTRSGLIDASWCDQRSMQMLVAYIALLEQVCTSDESSVVDYDSVGKPIYSTTSISKKQHEKLNEIQAECVRFARDAEVFFKASGKPMDLELMRRATLTGLCRLLFLPTKEELHYLRHFQFDLNLGTEDLLKVFDEDAGLTGLRKRGLFFMEKNLKTMRTNYPAELRAAGIELVMMLMTQHRYGFDIRVSDFSLRRLSLDVLVLYDNKTSQSTIEAMPTHDGYFSLLVPVGNNNMQIGILFGKYYKFIQLENAELIHVGALYSDRESQNTTPVADQLIGDQMEDKGGGLYECLKPESLLFYKPKSPGAQRDRYILRIIFRPIVEREQH